MFGKIEPDLITKEINQVLSPHLLLKSFLALLRPAGHACSGRPDRELFFGMA